MLSKKSQYNDSFVSGYSWELGNKSTIIVFLILDLF
jgi:hypothetical protein